MLELDCTQLLAFGCAFKILTLAKYANHKLAPSMYLCFYNTLTMCLRLSASEVLINH
jgi:hypothetical protein